MHSIRSAERYVGARRGDGGKRNFYTPVILNGSTGGSYEAKHDHY